MKFDNAVLSVCEGVTAAELDGELVLLNVNTGQYFGLNEIGALIFDKLKTKKPFAALLADLQAEFDVEEDRLKEELSHFLIEMKRNDLVDAEVLSTIP